MKRHLYLAAPSLLLGLGFTLPAQQPARAEPHTRQTSVTFQNGLLSVEAANASLNGLLHEIARSTGMKITGSVPEDRVFGSYGPADPQRVLSTLLDGTGVNVLIVSNAAETPLELQLTPRSGAPTPPRPTEQAQRNNDDDSGATGEAAGPQPEPRNSANSKPEQAPEPAASDPAANTAPSESTQPLVFPKISPDTAPATGTTTPADPDSDNDSGTENVRTPQQIFEQLQRLQGNNNQGTPEATDPNPER